MDDQAVSLQPLATPGAVTTFYAYEGGAARNAVLAALALQLAGSDAGAPVLVVDWDLDAPALHHYFGLPARGRGADGTAAVTGAADVGDAARPGLVEFFEACRAALRGAGGHDAGAAARVIDGAAWQAHIERADGRRPVYLLRAGRFDASYAERAGRLDWEALFDACPALFRAFAARLAGHFRHVLVASGAGRSAAVSVCSTLVPDRLVGLFTPAPGSIEGLEGVLRRAVGYRCTHEEEQRPLLLYPLACTADGARSDPHGRWRRGDVRGSQPGYQPHVEALLRACYGWPQVNLDSWFDEIQLALADAVSVAALGHGAMPGGEVADVTDVADVANAAACGMATGGWAGALAGGPAGGAVGGTVVGSTGDRRALARFAALLAEWVAPGRFPWQSLAEVRLRAAVAQARQLDAGAEYGAQLLASHLADLGELCRRERRRDEARACLEESLDLRQRFLGDDHPAARRARAALAALLLEGGALHDARRQYDLLVQSCALKAGPDDPETLTARSRLARTLAELGEGERALALHEGVVAACERALGAGHAATLDCLEDLAQSLVQAREFERARVVYERVFEARRRLQGSEHGDALRCGRRLALLLGETGDLGNARRMLEAVLRAYERHDGPDTAATVSAREALAEILAAQGDLAAVRSIQESLARTRERHLGAGHPETLSMQLRLASTLGQQGEAEAARRLRERVADLRRHLRDAIGIPAPAQGDHWLPDAPAAGSGAEAPGTALPDAAPLPEALQHVAAAASAYGSAHRLDHAAGHAPGYPGGYPAGDPAGHLPAHASRSASAQHAAASADTSHAADNLGHQLAELQNLIDRRSPEEARALADSLRPSVLRPSAAHSLRRRGAAMIKQVYLEEGDKDALLSFTQDEVSLLEGALIEAARDHQVTLLRLR